MSAPTSKVQTRAAAAASVATALTAEQIATIRSHYAPGAGPLVEAGLKSQAKIIVMYAEKGGVGKTTQSGSLAWGLAERGHRVLVYDCDAQRSLSNWLLSDRIALAPFNQDYDAFVNQQYASPTDNAKPRTLFQQLEPVRNQSLQVQAAYPITIRANLWLVPGDRLIVDYDAHIAAADALIQIVPSQANLMGAPYHAMVATGAAVNADYIIVDLNPSRGVLNRCIVSSAHFLITPVIADFFSFEMLRDLAVAMIAWQQRMVQLMGMLALMPPAQKAAINHPFPSHACQFMGYILSRYKIMPGTTLGQVQPDGLTNDTMSNNEAAWAGRVATAINRARTELLAHNPRMAIPTEIYNSIYRTACLSKVSEYHQLAALSGHFNVPVAFLGNHHMVTQNAAGQQVRMGNANAVYNENVRRFHSVTMATVDTIHTLAHQIAQPLPFQ